jgi:hypothetical protein
MASNNISRKAIAIQTGSSPASASIDARTPLNP